MTKQAWRLLAWLNLSIVGVMIWVHATMGLPSEFIGVGLFHGFLGVLSMIVAAQSS